MDEGTIQVFEKHTENKCPLMESGFWEEIMYMRAAAERAYSTELQKMLTRLVEYRDTEVDPDDHVHLREVAVCEAAVRKQLLFSGHDGAVYQQCGDGIESLRKNGKSSLLDVSREKLRSLSTDDELQKIFIQLKKEKRCADLKREEMKQLFSAKEQANKERLDQLKAESAANKDQNSLAEAGRIVASIEKISAKYEQEWQTMEQKNRLKLMDLLRTHTPGRSVRGGQLKQILPANEDGFAYGVYKESKLSKARKGFYPAANVRLLD